MILPAVSRFAVPDLGIGVGLRRPHHAHVLDNHPAMDFFEIISENFMVEGGRPRHTLDRVAAHYPVVPHGVSLSLGSAPEPDYLDRLSALVARLDPPWCSDHLCFTGVPGRRAHDLLPLPYTQEVLAHVVDRIRAVQDRLGRPFAVENVSSYLAWQDSELPEWDFLAEVAERADCAILLDVNNIFVSSVNHGFDPWDYLRAVPVDRVVQVHLAGHTVKPEGYRLDTHDGPVIDDVWALYRELIRRAGAVSTLIEWDEDIPSFQRLQDEVEQARTHRDAVLEQHRATG